MSATAHPPLSGAEDPTLGEGVSARHVALTSAAARVRVRSGKVPVEQILLAGACILFPLGVILIILGWQGAAHTGHTYEQLDYLISGGLLGLGLSIGGGFMYFGYWLSRQLAESRRQNALTLQALRRLEISLGGDPRVNGSGANGYRSDPADAADPVTAGVSARGRSTARGVDEAGAAMLVATQKGSLLHRPECPVVARRDGLREVPAGSEGYGYCTMCHAAAALA